MVKKYILALHVLLIVGQCHSATTDVLQAGKTLANIRNTITSRSLKEIDNLLITMWQLGVSDVIEYAIRNSKNLIGQKDMTLISVAQYVKKINEGMIDLYKALSRNREIIENNYQERLSFERAINNLSALLNQENSKLMVKYTTPSKQNAQKVLHETIRSLNMILVSMREKLDDIAILIR